MKNGTEVHPNFSDIKCSMCNYKHGNDAKLSRVISDSIMYTESVSKLYVSYKDQIIHAELQINGNRREGFGFNG
jgi:hypothetical protein